MNPGIQGNRRRKARKSHTSARFCRVSGEQVPAKWNQPVFFFPCPLLVHHGSRWMITVTTITAAAHPFDKPGRVIAELPNDAVVPGSGLNEGPQTLQSCFQSFHGWCCCCFVSSAWLCIHCCSTTPYVPFCWTVKKAIPAYQSHVGR